MSATPSPASQRDPLRPQLDEVRARLFVVLAADAVPRQALLELAGRWEDRGMLAMRFYAAELRALAGGGS